GERIPVVVDALGEVAFAFEGSGNGDGADALRTQLALEFLAPEEEQLLAALEDFGDIDWSAERAAQVVEPEKIARETVAIILPVVGVEAVVAVEPVSATVEIGGAALGQHVDLRAHRPAIFGLVDAGENLELLNGVQAERDVDAAVGPGVNVADA